jgi:hypothetical protein
VETSILYTLLNEAGREINVADLWDAFRYRLPGADGNEARINTGNEEEDEDDQDDEEVNGDARGGTEKETTNINVTLAQFYRALAELKMLGLVKSSSSRAKGVDVIMKTSWYGL